MSKSLGQMIGIRFTEDITDNVGDIVNAFIITGKEYKYINGPLVDGDYQIDKIEKHPTEPNSILITFKNLKRFKNVEGKIKVEYNATKGNLTGAGGPVESFEVEFTPEDLVQEPNPNPDETIKAYPYNISLVFGEIQYIDRYVEEAIKAYPYEILLKFINIDNENP